MRTVQPKIYGPLGLGIIVVMEMAALFDIPIADTWVTPIGWYGYILLVDALVCHREKTSLLTSRTGEFFIMLPISIALWCVFEWHNLYFKNWEYIGVPDNRLEELAGYAVAFATILPAMVVTNDLMKSMKFIRLKVSPKTYRPSRLVPEIILGLVFIGTAVLYPSPQTGPLVWIGYALFMAPLNALLGVPGIIKERATGDLSGTYTLMMSGLICGLVWEFLNFWAESKWLYHVPYWEHIKIFEMPVLGFLGFAPFAIAFVEMYRFIRFLPQILFKNRIIGTR